MNKFQLRGTQRKLATLECRGWKCGKMEESVGAKREQEKGTGGAEIKARVKSQSRKTTRRNNNGDLERGERSQFPENDRKTTRNNEARGEKHEKPRRSETTGNGGRNGKTQERIEQNWTSRKRRRRGGGGGRKSGAEIARSYEPSEEEKAAQEADDAG